MPVYGSTYRMGKTEQFYSLFESQINSFGQIVFNLFELNLFNMEAYILGHTV